MKPAPIASSPAIAPSNFRFKFYLLAVISKGATWNRPLSNTDVKL